MNLSRPSELLVVWCALFGASLSPSVIAEDRQQWLELSAAHRNHLAARRLNEAEAAAREMIEMVERSDRLGPRMEAASSIALAGVLLCRQDWQKASVLYRHSIALLEQEAVEPSILVNPLQALAIAESHNEQFDEARAICRRALAIAEKSFGPTDTSVAKLLNTLGTVEFMQSRYPAAIQTFERSQRILESLHGPDDPKVTAVLNTLGVLYDDVERHDEAEATLKRSLSICQRRHGADHPTTASAWNTLGCHYRNVDAHQDAETAWQKSLSILEQHYGVDHPRLLMPLHNLAGLYVGQSREEEVELICARNRRIVQKHPEADKEPFKLTLAEYRSSHEDNLRMTQATGQKTEAVRVIHTTAKINDVPIEPAVAEVAQGDLADADLPVGVPLLESLGQYESEAAYIKAAEAFVEQPGANSWKPRVANDLILYASLIDSDALKHRMQAVLLSDHSKSLFSQVLLHAIEADGVRSIVTSIAAQRQEIPHEKLLRRIQGVMNQGLTRFSDALINESIAETGALVGILAGDTRLKQICLNWFAINDEPLGDPIAIASDPLLAPTEKIESLIPLSDSPAARLLQDFLLASCSEADRELPSLVRAQLVNLAHDRRLEDASPLFDRLTDWSDDPQLLFLHMWSRIAADRNPDAFSDYQLLKTKHPESDWTALAKDVDASLRRFYGDSKTLTLVVRRVVQTLIRGEIRCFEMNVQLSPEFDAYVAFDLDSMESEVAFIENGELLFGLRRDGRRLLMYCPSEGEKVHQWELEESASPSLGVVPSFSFTEKKSGRFQFNFGLVISPEYRTSPSVSQTVAEINRLLEPDVFCRFLQQGLRHGKYYLVEASDDGGKSIRHGACNPIDPHVSEFRCDVSTAGLIETFAYKDLVCRRIRYGKSADFAFQPPAWPDVPTVQLSTPPVNTLIMTLMKLASSKQDKLAQGL